MMEQISDMDGMNVMDGMTINVLLTSVVFTDTADKLAVFIYLSC